MTYFGEDRVAAPEETVDLAGRLAEMVPNIGERDAIAADILMHQWAFMRPLDGGHDGPRIHHIAR